MKRTAILLVAVVILGLVPATAGAQTAEEKADAIEQLEAALDGLGGSDVAEWTASVEALKAAVDNIKEKFPDLDYAALDEAIGELEGEIEGGDLDAIAAAGDAVAAAGAAVAAEAAAEGEGEGGSAPAGGVDTGAGGTAGTDGFPAGLLVLGLLALVAAAGFFGRTRRTQN